jgi:MATE family multidrug resistance protein
MGPQGSAWATSAARTALLLSLLLIARRYLVPLVRPFDRAVLHWQPLWRTVRLGLPIGVQVQLEMVAFAVIALLMGGLGTVQMAAHQVTINLASLTFMVPLGVGQATSIRVGLAIGRGDGDGSRRAASAGLIIGAAFMTATAAAFILAPRMLASTYTSSLEVVALASLLIPIAGFFQVFDALQVVSAGVLRGAGDTRAPMVVNLLGFWCLGLPVSLGLAFGLGLGPVGLWWGLVVGLGTVAAFLLARIARLFRRDVVRVAVE